MRIITKILIGLTLLLSSSCHQVDRYIISSPNGKKQITLIRKDPLFKQVYQAYLVYGIYKDKGIPKTDYVKVGFEVGYTNFSINWNTNPILIYNAYVSEDKQVTPHIKCLFANNPSEADSLKKQFNIDFSEWLPYTSQGIVNNEYDIRR